MGFVYIIVSSLLAGEVDNNKFETFMKYYIWLQFIVAFAIVGYAVSGIGWCVGLAIYVFVIGLCVIFWKKDNEKEKKEEK